MERIAALALALLTGGCLATQDIHQADPDEVPVNHAPRIVVDQALVEGMPVHWLHVQSSCDRLRFKVGAVEDLDVGDDLELRFFLDYDRGCESCTRWQDSHVIRATRDTGTIRTTDFEYELQLPLDEGVHLVEAWVSDGFSSEENTSPANRTVLEGSGVDAVYWVIEVHDAENLACLPEPA